MKREEPSQLLHDLVLVGANDGHLGLEGCPYPDLRQHGAPETHPNMRQTAW